MFAPPGVHRRMARRDARSVASQAQLLPIAPIAGVRFHEPVCHWAVPDPNFGAPPSPADRGGGGGGGVAYASYEQARGLPGETGWECAAWTCAAGVMHTLRAFTHGMPHWSVFELLKMPVRGRVGALHVCARCAGAGADPRRADSRDDVCSVGCRRRRRRAGARIRQCCAPRALLAATL
jgi:hypothetical protein